MLPLGTRLIWNKLLIVIFLTVHMCKTNSSRNRLRECIQITGTTTLPLSGKQSVPCNQLRLFIWRCENQSRFETPTWYKVRKFWYENNWIEIISKCYYHAASRGNTARPVVRTNRLTDIEGVAARYRRPVTLRKHTIPYRGKQSSEGYLTERVRNRLVKSERTENDWPYRAGHFHSIK